MDLLDILQIFQLLEVGLEVCRCVGFQTLAQDRKDFAVGSCSSGGHGDLWTARFDGKLLTPGDRSELFFVLLVVILKRVGSSLARAKAVSAAEYRSEPDHKAPARSKPCTQYSWGLSMAE